MNIKLIAIDLDGTLLNSDKKFSEENKKAVLECIDKGIHIVPCTGRILEGIPEEIRELPGIRYAITINGARIVDIKEKKTISTCLLPKELTLKLLEQVKEYKLIYDIFNKDRGVVEEKCFKFIEEYIHTPGLLKMIKDTREVVPDITEYINNKMDAVDKINLFFTDMKERENVRNVLKETSGILVTSSMPNNLEINAEGADKGSGILHLAKYLGLKREETMGIGDGENDISMIQKSGIGVAMGNGEEILKEHAYFITDTNDNHGVAEAIKKLVFERN